MDLDALASVVALKRLYPDATLVLPSTKGKDVLKVLSENPHLVEFVEESAFSADSAKEVIVADTDSIDRIPAKVAELVKSGGAELIVFDHHSGKFDFKTKKLFFKEAGSTASILTMFLKSKGIVPSPLEASIIALGIFSDTGNFTFASTKPLDFSAAAYLFSCGANPEIIKRYLPKELSPAEIDILKLLKDNIEILQINANSVAITSAQFDSYVGDIAHLVSRLLDIEGFPALFAVIGVEGTVFLIGRSKSRFVDASKVAEAFGGGGHPQAASAAIRNSTVFEVKDSLVQVLKKVVKPAKRAKDIMSFPPKTVPLSFTAKEAAAFLVRAGVNCAPVVDKDGKFFGIISRALIDRAVYMGLEEETLESIADRDVEVVSPEAPVEEVERIIASNHQSLVPVVQDGRVIGVVTRTDILINLFRGEFEESEAFYRGRLSSVPQVRSLKKLMRDRLPQEILELLEKIGEVADKVGVNAYAVGGFVRDMILGRKNLDVDIVVEGDGIALAKQLGKVLNARVHVYEKFQTAVLILKNGFKFDVASARTEVYKSPGSLPEVDSAPLRKDLMRRDFTINTLAVSLNPDKFGKLIDFFNGYKDIKEKKIRVLHSLSFVEDPTRIIRALRFAVRFRFDIGKHTEKLIKIAVKKHFFDAVEGKRLYLELRHVFEEDNPLRVVNRMQEYGILKSFHRNFTWDKRKRDLFDRLRRIVTWHKLSFENKKTKYYLLYFSAFMEGFAFSDVENLLKKFSVPTEEAELIKRNVFKSKHYLKQIHAAERNSRVCEVLCDLSEEEILYLAGKAEDEADREKIISYLKDWRFLKPEVGGKELIELGLEPSPVFRQILDELRKKVIDGELKERDEQISFLKKKVKEVKKLEETV